MSRIGAWSRVRFQPGFRPAFAAVVAASVLLQATAPARGWGRIGHRASARVAESLLTPEARAAVRGLLDEGESLADASTWADEIRSKRPETGPWHYVNVPITEPGYDPKFCPEAGCVVAKIDDFRRVLADPNAPREQRREALRFLVHFIQDLHQPVHVGDRSDRGGNDLQLQFFEQGTNLHRLWDSGLIEKHANDENAWVKEITAQATPERRQQWAGKTAAQWADESHAAAKAAYLAPGGTAALKPGARLGQEYQDAQLPVARERLAKAASRLADVLNATLR